MHCTYRKTLCFRQWASVCENNCSRHHDLVNRYGFVTRDTLRVWHVELFTLPQHLSSPLDLSGVRARSLVFFVMFCRYVFVLFLLMFVLSVHRFTSSEFSLWYLQAYLTPLYFKMMTYCNCSCDFGIQFLMGSQEEKEYEDIFKGTQ